MKKLTLVMCLVMMFTLSVPSFVSAAEDKGLENAIKTAKAMFTIPSDYNFSYQMYTENGKRIWALSWNSKDGTKGGINVRLDDNGVILGYDSYKPSETNQRKLPKYSKKEAEAKAEAFIKKVNPSLISQIKLQDSNQENSISNDAYYFNYIRIVNKIPFYSNNVSVSINKDTGEAVSYSCNWTDGISFPSAAKTISTPEAEKSYINQLGLKLIYKVKQADGKMTAYPVYVPVYGENFAIDAQTGEKVQTGYSYGIYGGGDVYHNSEKTASRSDAVALTPDEMKAAEEASKLLSKEDAEKIARSCESIKITDDYRLISASLNKSWLNTDDVFWYFNFSTDNSGSDVSGDFVNVTVNAKTGEITGFNIKSSASDKDPVKFDEAGAKEAADEFIKSINPEKYSQVEYDNSSDNAVIKSSEEQRNFYFTYVRKVNGIPFPDNTITVNFDAVSGEITSFNINWFDADFAKLDRVITLEKAYQKAFAQIGLELQYKAKYSDDYYNKTMIGAESDEKPEIILAYSLNALKPWILDANTGTVIDNDGNPFKEPKTPSYTDIKGNYAQKQIEVLAEYGITLDGEKFNPNAKITQEDFLTLLSKIMPDYYGPIIPVNAKDTEVDSFYSFMIRQGVLKQSEKAPKSVLTKEEGVKLFIRALKYDKVAELNGIFKCSFKDAGKITPKLYGYIAIAQGLKIVSADKKGNVNPKTVLTRADAMVMIYNYLSN